MVAKIKTGRSILGAINYNERKVRSGKAELILAQGYLKEPSDLSFSDKVNRLTDLTKRNERTQVNALHVSLNFAVGENLDKWTLQQIADEYMEGLGFGKQPYLVYQHYDAGHPHLHLVSTNIKPDGERISFHLLANKASEQSRKQVELNYGLVKAEDQGNAQHNIKSLSLEQVAYGKSETKRAITNVVSEILRPYKFTSIPEFNAVLNGFNVTADRGSKESRMYEKNGLVYNPISFNPFYIAQGDYLDTEKKESIKAMILALWKKEDEGVQRNRRSSRFIALYEAVQPWSKTMKLPKYLPLNGFPYRKTRRYLSRSTSVRVTGTFIYRSGRMIWMISKSFLYHHGLR
jgi:hypothetical protein